MQPKHYKVIFLFLLLCSVEIVGRRGGGGGARGGGSRGSSAARSSSGGRGTFGGLFGGGGTSRTSSGSGSGSGGWTGGGTNAGRTGWGGGGGGNSYGTHGSSSGIFGRKKEPEYRTPSYSHGSGLGSHSRASTFKNMIIGAAAGVIAYEAGKAIIRSATAPMRWGGRDYYWGSQYYPGSAMSSGRQMCRMPIDSSDPQFGNVFLPGGQSRPKEVVWSCNYNEQCCGYECCPGGGGYSGYGGGYWNSSPGVGTGTIILLLLVCAVGACFLKHLYDKKRERDAEAEERAKYQQGNVSFSASAQPNAADGGPPPPYGFNFTPA